MLVLTRKPNEEIHIGPNVTITILRVRGQAVRVGIQAPKHLNVVRGELLGRPQRAAVVASETVTAREAQCGAPAAAAGDALEPNQSRPRADATGEPEMTASGRSLQRLSRCRATGDGFDFAARHPERSSPASHIALPASTPLGRRGLTARD